MYVEEILQTIHKYIDNIDVKPAGLYHGEDRLDLETMTFIIDVWRVSLGSRALESLDASSTEPELDEFEKILKEKEAKIRAIKNKTEKENTSMDRILITVMKEFNLKMSDLLPMNLYTIFWYYGYGLRYSNYHIESIAAGNGLLKKHKHYSE